MKQIILVLLLSVAFTSSLYAQDAIYTANGNRLPDARITDLTDERLMFTVQQADKLTTHSFQRDNVLVAFRKGNFLVIKNLSPDLAQAKQELQVFQTTTVWADKDYLLRAIPFEVIPAKISYENDAIVNYLTSTGKSASIPKGELIAIFYSDGRHALIRDPVDAVPFLAKMPIPFGSSTKTIGTSAPQPATPIPTAQPISQPAAVVPGSATAAIVITNKLVLSNADYQYYSKKAIDKVEQFSSYLNVITNKSLTTDARNQAIEQAVSLFMPAATIEVTSNSRPGSRQFPIRTYLNNLKRLPYTYVKIEWTDINYVKELSQAADGNYYGVLTGQQTFFGSGNGVSYTDITQKNVRVKVNRTVGTRNGEDEVKWDLLLGSIGVSN